MADGELPNAPKMKSISSTIDAICDRFETAWKAGNASPIEEVVQQVPEVDQGDLLLQLLLVELHWRRRRNEHPDQDDYEQRFPEHVDVIRKAFYRPDVAVSKAPRLADGLPVNDGPPVNDVSLVDTADQDHDSSLSLTTDEPKNTRGQQGSGRAAAGPYWALSSAGAAWPGCFWQRLPGV